MAAPERAGPSLSYLRSGDPSGPRIVLVHGSPGDATGWVDYLLAPPGKVEMVAVDRLGFGHSAPGPAANTLAAQATALQTLLPGDGRPVVLLGHSLGGAVVAWLAAQRPPQVKAVVLLASSLDPAQEVVHPMQRLAAHWPLRPMLPRAIRQSNHELLGLQDQLHLLQPMLAAVRATVVIVHGTDDDLVPVANVSYMQRHFTGARALHTKLLDGHNHFLPWNSMLHVDQALQLALEATC